MLLCLCLLVQQQDFFLILKKWRGKETYLFPVTINFVLMSVFFLSAVKAEVAIYIHTCHCLISSLHRQAPWLTELWDIWSTWLCLQDYEYSQDLLSSTVVFFKTQLMLSYVLISFWFKSLFTSLGLTTLQRKRYPATEIERAASVGVGSHAAHIRSFWHYQITLPKLPD